MNSITEDVMDYIALRSNYKACLGLVRTKNPEQTYLSWAALNPHSGHQYVPYLSVVEKLDPEAYWSPLTAEELRAYLRTHQQPAFLLSEQRPALAS